MKPTFGSPNEKRFPMTSLAPSPQTPTPCALVHPPETKPVNPFLSQGGEPPDTLTLSQNFRHAGWHHNRSLVNAALQRTRQSVSRIVAFQSCGYHSFVYRSLEPPYRYRLGGSSCHDRFCIPCARDRSHLLALNVLESLGTEPVRFLTLTLKHADRPLADQLDRLYASFRFLRDRSLWKSKVTGGAAFLEVAWADGTQQWHVHLHCLVHGKYLERIALSRLWHEVTGDSMVIDIRIVSDRSKIARYVTKYVSKPLNNTFLNRPALLDAVLVATKGRRLCLTFGDWRGIKLTAHPTPDAWECLGSFFSIANDAYHGDEIAQEALHAICPDVAHYAIQVIANARPPPPAQLLEPSQILFQWPGGSANPWAPLTD